MDKKNAIKVLNIVGAMNRAGTETMLMNVYRNIDRDKYQFDFISYSQNEAHYDKEITRLGGKVIRLSKTASIRELYRAIKENGPYDVVHSHTLFHCGLANIAAKLAGVKVRIAHAHTTLDRSDSIIRKLYIQSMRLIIRLFSTHLLACSKEAGKYLFGERSLNSHKYQYFPNLINYSQFIKEPQKEAASFKAEAGLEKCLVIGHIGRFIEPKNHRFLLDIMKNIIKKAPSAKLLLVGDGDLRLQIEERARIEGLYDNIRFVGLRGDIHTMLHSMDLFVFPSIYEGLGLVLLEAQASGLPCIVSEAIQPEADLKIGLVTRLSLSDGAEVWTEKIIENAGKKEKDIDKIKTAFKQNGYVIETGLSKLMGMYESENGSMR